MSLKGELAELQKQRAREIAIKAALSSMEPEVIEKGTEKSIETSTAETLPVLPPFDPTTNTVARVVDASPPGKPWMRGNVQWRPMRRAELQQQQDEMMDKKALDQLQSYRVLQQRSQDEFDLETKATEKRRDYEVRTGRRPLPERRTKVTYIGPAEATPPAESPWDNKRQSGRFGAD